MDNNYFICIQNTRIMAMKLFSEIHVGKKNNNHIFTEMYIYFIVSVIKSLFPFSFNIYLCCVLHFLSLLGVSETRERGDGLYA
jgi:hypothetical protein